ncbi:MAG TPA: primosomal protein N' [Anaerolineae bacterium]|nr:primosomal protein N' [Anaerolineae bacterium]
MYATVILTRPTHRRLRPGSEPVREPGWRTQTFSYRLAGPLQELALVGHLVRVPLQAGSALGVIAAVDPLPPPGLPPEGIRDLLEIIDPLPVVTEQQLDLARWMAGAYLAPISQALRLMLPPGLEDRTFVLVQSTPGPSETLSAQEARLLDLLKRAGGKLKLSTLLRRLPGDEGEAAFDRLAERGLVESRSALVLPRAAPPRLQYASLLAGERTVEAALPRLGHASKQADLLLLLARQADTPPTLDLVCAQAGCTPAALQPLVERGWVRITPPRTLLVALPGSDQAPPALERAPKQVALLAALRGQPGPVDLALFLAENPGSSSALRELEKKDLVRRIAEPSLVLLDLPPEQVLDRVVELRGGEKERVLLDALRGSAGRVWVGGLYAETGAGLAALQRLAARGLVSLHTGASDRPQALAPAPAPDLSADQEAAWAALQALLDAEPGASEPRSVLLRGAPGSGKGELLLRAVEQTLAAGRRALVLVPEVSLTAQALRRFEARFPHRVALLHGQQTLGQRYDAWDAVRRGQADVVIGSRAALFAPISRLGLVVVDEAHDPSYKQQDPFPPPAYHACDVALELARVAGAAAVYATPVPSVEMVQRAVDGALRLVDLPPPVQAPASGAATPDPGPAPVRIVDLRQELFAGNRSIFSRALRQVLSDTLAAGEQAILFLNRRGSATFILCRDCGYVARCPRCGIPLALHRPHLSSSAGQPAGGRDAGAALLCHRCNHRAPAPETCPQCGGRRIRHFGLGTERVEADLRRLFPAARLLRWDGDTAAGADPAQSLRPFLDHAADLLIGTQGIARGLDLPPVRLVGVISADTALNLPDLYAGERTFQLLARLAALAAPAALGGQVILQTYDPDHHALRAVAEHDHALFYRKELSDRARLGYPPFGRLLALGFQDADPLHCRDEASRLARWLKQEIRSSPQPVDVIGPAPCFYAQVAGRFRWQIILRAASPADLLRDAILPAGWRVDVDPIELL